MTLPRFFALMVGGLALLAVAALTLAVRSAGEAIIRTGEASRLARATQVAGSIERDLGAAERAMEDLERALAAGVVDQRDAASVRRALTVELIALRNLTELSFTAAELLGFDGEGRAILATAGRRQISVFRDGLGELGGRTLEGFEAGGPEDPTLHDTFQAAARSDARGQALWSDLAYTELDRALPVDARRKTLTVQKAIFARDGRFSGVLRAGIVSDTLDRLGTSVPTAADASLGRQAEDPHRLFICDELGRLVTRLSDADRYATVDEHGAPDPEGDLRVVPSRLPAPVAAALDFARLKGAGGARMDVGGVPHLLTLLPLAEGRAQRWLVGVVVPEGHYVGTLTAARDRLLGLLVAVAVAVAAIGLLSTRTVGRGVHELVQSTEAMRRFSFVATPTAVASPFREIRGALESVERAKTALRAMVKYVPVELVRRLYQSGQDPVLGAVMSEVSVMFTDIEDFTTHAERLPPDALAASLGKYLEIATRAVEETGGIVDKYIGDALMVLWNVPEPVGHHPAAACRAALGCARATAALSASAWWREAGLPGWRTRFGLHTGRVLVGNFGAPSRLSYTAIGDGVNLAARLEGLNKVYGTTILATEDVRAQAGDAFVFRLVDRVAVKGKTRAVAVFELLGEAGDPVVEAKRPLLARYEEALAATVERRFSSALELLAELPADGPAAVLAKRCHQWLVSPPPATWNGTWSAPAK